MLIKRAGAAKFALAWMTTMTCSVALAADQAQHVAPLRALGFELLLLVPLAGIAFYLKRKKRSPKAKDCEPIVFSSPQHLGDGVKAQIITVGKQRLLLVHGKNGSVHTTPLAPIPPSLSDSEALL